MIDPNILGDGDLPVPSAAEVQRQQMSLIPAVYKTNQEKMMCELALGMEEPEDIFARYGYSPEHARLLQKTPEFGIALAKIAKEVHASGLTFKTKVRAMAEDILPHAYNIAIDPEQPTAERVKLMQWMGKLAGHEPKEKDNTVAGGGFSLNITFAGEAPQKVVTGEQLTIEQQ